MSLAEFYFRGVHNTDIVRDVTTRIIPSPQRDRQGFYTRNGAAPPRHLVPRPPPPSFGVAHDPSPSLSSIPSINTARSAAHGRMLPCVLSPQRSQQQQQLPPMSPRRQANQQLSHHHHHQRARPDAAAVVDPGDNLQLPSSGRGEAAGARRRREAELLEVMRFRRERYEAAVRSAHGILERLSAATEFVPKEEGLKLRPPPMSMTMDARSTHHNSLPAPPHATSQVRYYASVDQMPSYHVKQNGHELTVLTEPCMEDPFLLDDVDADEQQGLSEMVKRVEEAKKRKAAKLARKQQKENQAQQPQQLVVGEGGAALEGHEAEAPAPTPPRNEDGEQVQEPDDAVGDDDNDDVAQVHPSEVARKRRIMRKVWMGGIVHLRDLYASKDGSLHATTADGTVDTSRQAVSAAMMSSSAFADSDAGDGETEFFDYGDADETDHAQPSSVRLRRVAGGDNDSTTPAVPPFSSRSLAWICESIARDMVFVTASTETMLRTAMGNGGARRAGTLDHELLRCRHCVLKTMAWTSGAETHARMFASGEHMVNDGVSMEVAAQRRVLLRAHEELSEVQKAADDADEALAQLREQVEELRHDKLILSVALRQEVDLFGDPASPTVSTTTAAGPAKVVADDVVTREIMARLRLRLCNASAEISVARSGRRRLTSAHGTQISANSELNEADEAIQRIAEALVQKGDGRFRFEMLTKGASRSMLLRRRQTERSLLPQ